MPSRKASSSVKASRPAKATKGKVVKSKSKKKHTSKDILHILDEAAKIFTFPCLDNGYVYLADTRLSLYRSDDAWGLVIEIFGYNNRSMSPELAVFTFSNALSNRNPRSQYVSAAAHKNYLKNNPYNDSDFYHPISNWANEESESVKASGHCFIRGKRVAMPSLSDYQQAGIEIDAFPAPQDFCRCVVLSHRDALLGTDEERCHRIDLPHLLTLDTWHHPDTTGDGLPSTSESFIQIVELLAGERLEYTVQGGNTHWRNWPEGGAL